MHLLLDTKELGAEDFEVNVKSWDRTEEKPIFVR